MPTVSRIESVQGNVNTTVKFPCRHVATPRLPHGFSGLDAHVCHSGINPPQNELLGGDVYVRHHGINHPLNRPLAGDHLHSDDHRTFRVQSTVRDIKDVSAVYRVEASLDTKAVVNSLNLAPADVDFLTGEHCLDVTEYKQAPSVHVKFGTPFITPPNVVVFFNFLDVGSQLHTICRISATANQVDAAGFTLTIESSAGTITGRAQACWIAYPADREHIFSTSLNLNMNPPLTHRVGAVRYNKAIAFWKIPSVFVALHMLDFTWGAHLHVNAYVDRVTMSDLVCLIEARYKNLHSVGVTIIAIN